MLYSREKTQIAAEPRPQAPPGRGLGTRPMVARITHSSKRLRKQLVEVAHGGMGVGQLTMPGITGSAVDWNTIFLESKTT